jgi:hypothetical protein
MTRVNEFKIPEAIMEKLEAVKDEIIEHQGQEVYDAVLAGKYQPHQVMMLISWPDKSRFKG